MPILFLAINTLCLQIFFDSLTVHYLPSEEIQGHNQLEIHHLHAHTQINENATETEICLNSCILVGFRIPISVLNSSHTVI